ncbi:hypothetical protein HPP92_016622 [Vanilla planifolia]|uniref:Uncharacterized protein n=1 Tax=Vanilla planifolia TaxID=51239 RepID=A0A835UUD6_VANPL|nr:hypothetical protein HPP92_016622 [Vanilla planifolia]
MTLNSSDVMSSDNAVPKQGRPPLEIDLNVPDDRAVEDMASQSSAQTTGSESGVISNHDAPLRSAGGLDLDLNLVDEGAENGQFFANSCRRLEVPVVPTRSAAEGFQNGEVNILRDFDLNNGPSIDDVVAEPVPRSQNTKICANIPIVTPTSLGMNNSNLGSGWFPPGNSYPAVAIPSFLPDRGDHPYPIVAAAGAQRILGSVTGAATIGSEVYRGPVLSSSPALSFSPAATAFSYAGFPFNANFPLASTAFSAGSSNYVDPSSAGGPYFPPIPSPLVGPGVGLSSRPGSTDELKDDRLSSSRQLHAASSHSFMEDPGGLLKRKEPDGGWESERFTIVPSSLSLCEAHGWALAACIEKIIF